MRAAEWVWSGLQAGYRKPVTPVLDARWDTPGLHVLIGRNGAGKSTLLRTAAGLHRPLAGRSSIGGQDVHGTAALERARLVAFLPSTPPRGVGLTVGQVLQLLPGTDAERQAALAATGAEQWWDVPVSRLSDGETQRVMLARVLFQNAAWTVLDEPTAFLDPAAAARVRSILVERCRERLVLVSSHDPELIALADQRVQLN
jgi:iron complex transport system ATP-binding protein